MKLYVGIYLKNLDVIFFVLKVQTSFVFRLHM